MNERLLEVALRRERLLERIRSQRERLAGASDGVRALCSAGDRAIAAGRKIRDNPHWVLAAVAAFAFVRPKRAWRLFETGVVLWRAWVAVRRRLPRLAAR